MIRRSPLHFVLCVTDINIQAKSRQFFELSAYLENAVVVMALWLTVNDAELQP